MLCLPQFIHQWLLRPYNHREIQGLAGLAKHPSGAGARGQTERVIPNALHGPTGKLRNQKTSKLRKSGTGRFFAVHDLIISLT